MVLRVVRSSDDGGAKVERPAVPWDRQPGESSPAYEAWIAYRDGGSSRSYRTIARALRKSPSLVSGWASRWHWQDRIRAWESELSQRALAAEADEARLAVRLHARSGHQLVTSGIRRLVGDEASGVRPLDLNTLSAQDVVRLIDAGVKIERQARGLATETLDLRSLEADARQLGEEEGFSPEEIEEVIRRAQRFAAEHR